MAQFSVNPQRFDPYKNFKFRVKWDGRYVAGISKITGFKRSTEVVKHRDGGDPSSSRKSPGRTEYDAITLERGVTHDTEFEKWTNKVWNFGSGLGAGRRDQLGRPIRKRLPLFAVVEVEASDRHIGTEGVVDRDQRRVIAARPRAGREEHARRQRHRGSSVIG